MSEFELPVTLSDLGICCGNSDLVVRPARYEAFVKQAAVGIEIDQIAIVRHAARANKRRQALVNTSRYAIEHLIDNAIDAVIAGVIERNAGRQRTGERDAGIVETLITKVRTGVVPGAYPVSARKPLGIVALIEQIARFRDEKGAAAKAKNGPGRERRRLIGAVSAAGIAAECGCLKRHVVGWFNQNANAWVRKRKAGPPAGRLVARNVGQLMPLLMKFAAVLLWRNRLSADMRPARTEKRSLKALCSYQNK